MEQLPERHTAAREARGLLHGVPGRGRGIAICVCGCGGELCEFPPFVLEGEQEGAWKASWEGGKASGKGIAVMEWDLWLTGMFRWW